MRRIQELDERSWKYGYSFACVRNEVTIKLFSSFKKETRAYRYLKDIKEGKFDAVHPLVEEMGKNVFLRNKFLKDCVLVAIPPSIIREKQPVFVIAEELGKKFGIEVILDGFSCIYYDPVKKLEPWEKAKHRKVQPGYLLNDQRFSEVPKDRKIVLFDDYYDEGNTIEAAAAALKKAGFTEIVFFTVCLTQTAERRIGIIRSNLTKKVK